MHSVSALLSLALVLVAPGLCRGGLLVHPCDDEHAPSTPHDSHHEKEGGCGHEDGCALDPCSLAVRTTPSSRISADLNGDSMHLVPPVCHFETTISLALEQLTFRPDQSPSAGLTSPQRERCPLLLI